MWGPDLLVAYGPRGRTLKEIGGPCLSAASWLASSWERSSRGAGGRRRTLGDEHCREPDERARNHTFRMIPFFPSNPNLKPNPYACLNGFPYKY